MAMDGRDACAAYVARRFGFRHDSHLDAVVAVFVPTIRNIRNIDCGFTDWTRVIVEVGARGRSGSWNTELLYNRISNPLCSPSDASNRYHWHNEEHELGEAIPD
jgi:hypothetical protein